MGLESSGSTTGSALRAEAISIAFGGLRVLDAVDLHVDRGEIVGLLGPNGAGKTTLFDCISGFLACSGTVFVDGADVTRESAARRARAGLARSFQDARLYPSLTVLDTLRTAASLHLAAERQSAPPGVIAALLRLPSSSRAEARATELATEQIETLGLQAYRDKLIRELSTGTRRVVDLAGLMLQRPKVVLLDEPSSGIAQREVEALRPLLLDVRQRTGCSILLIEHDMPLLLGLADRVYALETGAVIASGAPDDVVNHPDVVRSYLGADPAAIQRSGAVATTGPR